MTAPPPPRKLKRKESQDRQKILNFDFKESTDKRIQEICQEPVAFLCQMDAHL